MTQTLLSGLGIGESARWHDGRFWFAHWGTHDIVAVDDHGKTEVVAQAPGTMGVSIDWLPDGRLLITGDDDLFVQERDGELAVYGEGLRDLAMGWNEIVVDGRGNVYVNSINFDFADFNETLSSDRAPGVVALVTPDGSARRVADNVAFPNGMIVTPDNSTLVLAESFAAKLTAFDIAADGSLSNRRMWADLTGDGICMDAEGAVWTSEVSEDGKNACLRVREGGEVLQRVELERNCFSCMLGGEDGKTLYMMVAEWFGPDKIDELIAAKTGQVLTERVSVPHAGHP